MTARLRSLALAVVGAVAIAAVARCGGAAAARDDATRVALADTVRALRAQLQAERATRDSLVRVARATVAPHEAAQRATDRQTRAARALEAELRAAARADSLALDSARALLVAAADRIDSLILAHGAERTAGVHRIAALERTVTYVIQTTPTVDALVAAQARQASAVLRRRPWIQRVLGEACTTGLAATGGGGGALVAGPLGAAIGAGGGYVTGRLACR